MKIIYEPTSKGLTHLVFNSSFLRVVNKLNQNEELYFFGDQEHLEHIKNDIDKTTSKIIFKNLKIYSLNKKIRALYGELFNLIKIKFFDIKKKSDELVITNSHAHTLLFTKFLFSRKKVTFVLHGSIEELLRKKNFLQLGFYNKLALKYMDKNENFRYIVLGDSIKENLLEIIPSIKSNLYSIEHPYTFKNNTIDNDLKTTNEINIGSIGNAALEKGSSYLFEIEDYLNEKGINNINLFHIGSFKGIDIPFETNVQIPSLKGMLPRSEYEGYINNLDYILFFYPSDAYKLTASGAIFDAISYNKPIIAIENDYFRYIFEICGDIGFLCKDIEEIKSVLYDLHNRHSPEQYREIVNQINDSKNMFSYIEIAKDVRGMGLW